MAPAAALTRRARRACAAGDGVDRDDADFVKAGFLVNGEAGHGTTK